MKIGMQRCPGRSSGRIVARARHGMQVCGDAEKNNEKTPLLSCQERLHGATM